jgi:hypothetical protein
MTPQSKWSFFKSFLCCIILIGLGLSVYIGFDQIRPETNPDNNMSLSKFIIGTWEPIKQLPLQLREIQFINENKLWYDVLQMDDGYQEEAVYQFTNDTTIQVQGRRDTTIEKWELARTSEKLEICFRDNHCVVYARERIKWWWILVTLSAVILAFYLLKKFAASASQSSI